MKKEIQELIKHHTHNITDENQNKWEVIEVSELTDILEQDLSNQSVSDEEIGNEFKKYLSKLITPITDFEKFRIEIAFEYAAKWMRDTPTPKKEKKEYPPIDNNIKTEIEKNELPVINIDLLEDLFAEFLLWYDEPYCKSLDGANEVVAQYLYCTPPIKEREIK